MKGGGAGADPPLTREQQALVRAHLGLVEDVAFRCFGRLAGRDIDRIRSLGAEGLIDAARKFDPSRGAQFRTYAWWRVRGAIRNGLRDEAPCTNELLERGVLAADEHAAWMRSGEGEPHETEAVAADRFRQQLESFATAWCVGWLSGGRSDDPETALQQGFRERALREMSPAQATLPERDQQVLHLRDELGLPWAEIARSMEISEATAHRYHHGAIERLSKRLHQRLDEEEV